MCIRPLLSTSLSDKFRRKAPVILFSRNQSQRMPPRKRKTAPATVTTAKTLKVIDIDPTDGDSVYQAAIRENNVRKIAEYLQQACDLGHVRATFRHGEALYYGLYFLRQNRELGKFFLTQAAEKGDQVANLFCMVAGFTGESIILPIDLFVESPTITPDESGDLTSVMALNERLKISQHSHLSLSEQSVHMAISQQSHLARTDSTTMLFQLQRAKDIGKSEMAWHYLGFWSQGDQFEPIEMFKEASARGNLQASQELAGRWRHSYPELAWTYDSRACDQMEPEQVFQILLIYQDHRLQKPAKYPRYLELLERVATEGDGIVNAQHLMGIFLASHPDAAATAEELMWYRLAGSNGDVGALFSCAVAMKKDGPLRDEDEAVKLLEECIQKRFYKAACELGFSYFSGWSVCLPDGRVVQRPPNPHRARKTWIMNSKVDPHCQLELVRRSAGSLPDGDKQGWAVDYEQVVNYLRVGVEYTPELRIRFSAEHHPIN